MSLIYEVDAWANERAALAMHHGTPVDVVDTNKLVALAWCHSTPVDVLMVLAFDKDWFIRSIVAGNPNTPTDALAILSCGENYLITERVINNNKTPAIILDLLAKTWTRNTKMMHNIAQNPRTLPETLVFLASINNYELSAFLSRYNKTPIEALKIIYNNSTGLDYDILFSLACNRNTPISIIDELISSKYESVTDSAKKNKRTKCDGEDGE